MIYLYSDLIGRAGGIETYLHALAIKLREEKIPFRVAVAEREKCPLVDELVDLGVDVYRQRRIPGDTWCIRQRFLMFWLKRQLKPGDWVYCVRQPMPELYLPLVRKVHEKSARIAASWMLAPEFVTLLPQHKKAFCRAVKETDAVISVSECTVNQFLTEYGYKGPVHVVRYHNLPVFNEVVPIPKSAPPWRIGFMGRLHIKHKNLDTLFYVFRQLIDIEPDVELHLYGNGGSHEKELKVLAKTLGVEKKIHFHGYYDHRRDLEKIISDNHFFVYLSRFEGGPCFTLLELIQAGRYVVASNVGGIPDIYKGHDDIGKLVSPDNEKEILIALLDIIKLLKESRINPAIIRSRYFQGFDMQFAHSSWMKTLGINKKDKFSAQVYFVDN